jgi:uncharacterized protein (UPF0261 family)
VRTSAEELKQVATIVAERLNVSKAPCTVIIPMDGWSSLDQQGRSLYDPEADRAFMEELRKSLKPDIPVKEVNFHLNTPEFGREAVEVFHQLFIKWRKTTDEWKKGL